MATAVFLNLPAHGHINPTLPFVAELVRRGERVVYYATDSFRHKIERTGATFRSYGPHYQFDPTTNFGGPLPLMARSIEATEAMLPSLLAELRADPPDYLLVDATCVWGNFVQQVLRCPAVCSTATPAVNSRVFAAMSLSDGPRPSMGRMGRQLPDLLHYFRVARRIDRRYGTKHPGFVDFFTNRQALNLVWTSRDFQPQADSFDGSYRFVGPAIGERHETVDFPWERLGDAPLLYVSLGTVFNDDADFFRAAFAAFADQSIQVVVSIGTHVDEAALGPPPANVLVRRYVPQLAILERATLFVTHGGMNSVSEGLLFGVPLLVVPQEGDQFLIAQRVAELGAGLTLAAGEVTPERLRAGAAHLLGEPSFRERARAVGDSLRAAGGASRAADEVERFKARVGIA